jgi:hypothetical protein
LRIWCLEEYFDLREMKQREAGENCIVGSFIIVWARHESRKREMGNSSKILLGNTDETTWEA